MATVKLMDGYDFSEYGIMTANTKIDMMRPHRDGAYRWTFHLIFDAFNAKPELGVDGKGHRGSGFAECAVISNTPQVHVKYPLVAVGDIIETPFGKFSVDYRREFSGGAPNRDALTLTPVSE